MELNKIDKQVTNQEMKTRNKPEAPATVKVWRDSIDHNLLFFNQKYFEHKRWISTKKNMKWWDLKILLKKNSLELQF